MKKILLMLSVFAASLMMTGCAGEPAPSVAGDSKQKTSTLSGNDVTALGFKFGSFIHVGDTITLTNSDGSILIDRKGERK